jgi:hypothetical protein
MAGRWQWLNAILVYVAVSYSSNNTLLTIVFPCCVSPGRRNWFERKQMKRLLRPVDHAGNSKRSQSFPVGFRDIYPSQRKRATAPPLEGRHCIEPGSRRGPCDAVHAGSPPTLILSHPSDGECLAAEREGQQPLQGVHPAIYRPVSPSLYEPAAFEPFRRNPYPSDYRTAFAFSALLCSHLLQLSSRLACPSKQSLADADLDGCRGAAGYFFVNHRGTGRRRGRVARGDGPVIPNAHPGRR